MHNQSQDCVLMSDVWGENCAVLLLTVFFPSPFLSAFEAVASPSHTCLPVSFTYTDIAHESQMISLPWHTQYLHSLNVERMEIMKHTKVGCGNLQTGSRTSPHGPNCFCVSNYDSVGSGTEHLGALQWNTL